ncbi:MAG: FG-GAP repeat domain-containing protein [Salinivenus sp.]
MRRQILLAVGVCVLSVVLLGCAGASQSGQNETSPEFPEDYHRVVTPDVVVEDSTGRAIGNPFYGGLNTPRPQFVDIDGDGDEDLFLQERSGKITFFERVTEDDTSRLVWRTDDYQGLDVGEWFRFADLDQDGTPDLLAEQQYSHIRVYRNVGSETDPEFELFTDSLRTPDGTAIFSDRQNIPNVTDIDCDGNLDLFLGRLDGTITRYEAEADTAGMPQFAHVTDDFEGIEIVNQQVGLRHGANTLTFADINDDDAPDLFWGDFFEPGLLLIENTGSCGNPSLSSEPEPFPPSNPLRTSGYNAPTLTDWTGNGHLDLFVGVLGGSQDANESLAENFYFYENTGDRYRLRTRQFTGGLNVGSESDAAFGDVTGDDAPDLLLANKVDPKRGETSVVYRLKNEGTEENPRYRRDGVLDLPSAYHYAPALGDLTDNGTADLLLGTWKGRIAYHRNQGDGTFESVDEALVEVSDESHVAPALGDLTGNGRPDLVVGTGGGTLQFYRNTGSADAPEFTRESGVLEDVDVGARASPEIRDLDGDGVRDLVVGAKEGLFVLENEGTDSEPSFGDTTRVQKEGIPSLATPVTGDLDGDGRFDLMMGGERGGIVLLQPGRP